MRASHFALPVLALAALTAGYLSVSRTPAGRLETPAPTAQSAPAQVHVQAPARPAVEVLRRRYALDYRHQVSIDGQAIEPTSMKGTWTTESLPGGRVSVQLSNVVLGGIQDIPAPAEVTAAFQIATEAEGRLDRLGFSSATPPLARGLLTTVACALQYTPGDGARWTAVEEDRTGRYRAAYERRGDEVIRRHERYLAAREATGLNEKHASRLSTEGTTRYLFDDQGITKILFDQRIRMTLGGTLPTLDVRLQATLSLVGSTSVAARTIEPLPLEALRAHGQGGESGARAIEIGRLNGAKLPELVNKALAVREIQPGSPEEQAWHAETFLRVRALLRVDPSSASALAEAFKAHAEDDPRAVSVLAGALGDAGTSEATDALVELLSSDVPTLARMHVVGALGMDTAPSAASAEALTRNLDNGDVGSMSALALGTQAGRLAGSDASASVSAIAELLKRYAAAVDPVERLTYLNALANSGAPEAFPVMRAALTSDDPALAEAAAYGLRFIPGAEVDALLAQLLGSPIPDHLKVQVIRAIGYRQSALWQDPLQKALAQYSDDEILRAAIQAVLATWNS